jgi:prepilin-type N-terminal cleavage/methylation domain-containing protein
MPQGLRNRVRLSDERGFTLPELLVAMSVGMIVLLAAFMVLDRSFTASGEIADRSDALQRGRQTMDLMTRQLRSQVCLGTTNNPIVSGSPNSVTFYANLSENSQSVQRRTLTYDPPTKQITQSVVTGAGTYPNLTFNGAATTVTLLSNVEQIMDGTTARPVFRYYGYVSGTTTGALESLGATVSPANLGRVAVIKIGFRAFPFRSVANNDSVSAVLENDVYSRVAVPTSPQNGPLCA